MHSESKQHSPFRGAVRRVGQVALAMAPVAFLIVETAGRTWPG